MKYPTKKKSSMSPEEEGRIASSQWDRYERARDNGHLEYIEMAKKCDAYYQGDQWEIEDVSILDAEGRPALTVNTILPTINTVLGEQSTRRADIQFKPRRGGSEEVADTLNKLYMQIGDNNKLDWVEQQVFIDGLIMDGRGYFDVRIDFSDHVEGEVRITAKDPLDILIDPDAKEYDPKTWNEVFETKWMTLDDIEELYGKDKAEDLRFISENGNSFGRDSIEYEETRYGDTESADDYLGSAYDSDEYKSVRALRVIERQHRKLTRMQCYVDPETGDSRPVPEAWNDRKVKKFAKDYGLEIISKMSKKVRWTVTCDKVVLFDGWSPYNDFTIVPYFAYFRRGRPFGMVRNLLSPQEQLNKISSQELHIVNTTANSGWMVAAAFWAIRSKPVGIVLGLIFIGGVVPRAYSTTRPVSAPCSSRSSVVIPTKDPLSTIQPLLAVVFTICSSWELILLSCSCGDNKFLTIPKGLPLRKYAK